MKQTLEYALIKEGAQLEQVSSRSALFDASVAQAEAGDRNGSVQEPGNSDLYGMPEPVKCLSLVNYVTMYLKSGLKGLAYVQSESLGYLQGCETI